MPRPFLFTVPALLFGLIAGAHALEQEDFRACLGELEQKAIEDGIDPQLVRQRIPALTLQTRVVELDRKQPEFTSSFADYYGRRVTTQRIKQGRELRRQHADLLAKVEAEYGVPAAYLLSFWGLETNYGGFYGNTPVLDALATLACEGRRGAFFTAELMNALRIVEEGAITVPQMEGSWAGAMGHVQFMPSTFLRYAVDGDGDGRRDLWHSLPDALSSAANFLNALGWRTGERWGREVWLPDQFDYGLAGLDESWPLSYWRERNVRLPNGQPLPDAPMNASLLLPSGAQGPAFLVYENFRVIMGWNRSEAYALAVGRLADRINGAGELSRAPVPAPRLHRDQVKALQARLNADGFKAGSEDGLLGPGTRAALGRFQQQQGLPADGFPDEASLKALGILKEKAEAKPGGSPQPQQTPQE
ncbi:Lytic murein transglycosylase subfamily [Alloalcanivorax dieselolei B5]|uniref:Lytic murein transglycosylase subfamily n=1 Tax=Alcanivorax dieselolei (strain DSM 16502 / CGMCC 1.3690 / MCCC 1A00001 / B-5) TaxID=930169 RepID=K0C8I6_ALCDB|nr:lytic murein transglycosylase [Alloalcanivorax dieselolei]AFT68810.1 Lytic murein transglycosylase subfamily [Alloalcanivorax dieselolei B5]GGK06652.1 lytic transglycosylase [Alloalcanivorax dieselolei]